MRKILVSLSFLSAVVSVAALADYQPAPQQYSLINVGDGQTQHVYRNGNKALIDLVMPKTASQPKAIHMRTIVDIPAKQTLTWDVRDKKVPCNSPATVSDWGDPFNYWDQTVQGMPGNMTQKGKAKVNGMNTTLFEITSDKGSAELWREDKYGLLVKAVMTPKGGKPVQIFEIRKFKVGIPKLSVFAVPKRCTWKH